MMQMAPSIVASILLDFLDRDIAQHWSSAKYKAFVRRPLDVDLGQGEMPALAEAVASIPCLALARMKRIELEAGSQRIPECKVNS